MCVCVCMYVCACVRVCVCIHICMCTTTCSFSGIGLYMYNDCVVVIPLSVCFFRENNKWTHNSTICSCQKFYETYNYSLLPFSSEWHE